MPLSTLLLTAALCMQDPKPSAPPAEGGSEQRTAEVEEAARALTALRRGPEHPGAEALAAAGARLQGAMESILNQPEGLEWEHLARCIQVLWATEQTPGCASICELALERHEPTADLHTQLGMCKLAMAQAATVGAEVRRLGRESAAAFRAGLALGEREPAVVFLPQSLAAAGEHAAALTAIDAVLAHPRFRSKAEPRHSGRAIFCLLAGDYGQTVVELEKARTAGEELRDADELRLVRALALAGRGEDAVAKARELWSRRQKDSVLTLLADVLGCTGAVDEAVKLLRDHPPDTSGMSAEDQAATKRSRDVFAYLLELRGKRPDDLRERLRVLLQHEPKVMGLATITVMDTSRPEKDRAGPDLNHSPLALGHHLSQVPIDACAWANDALFLVCVEDVPGWQASPLEKQLLTTFVGESAEAIVGEDAVAKARAALASHRMMPYAEGILTATFLLGAK